jgi:hypothetical protein
MKGLSNFNYETPLKTVGRYEIVWEPILSQVVIVLLIFGKFGLVTFSGK